MPEPQLIQVKKYPNRRLYDSTRSRHLTHAELYDLVVTGHTVQVVDSRTGADITNLVLAQALIERCPEKFAAFPPEVSHLMIRASEQVLRGLASGWFAQVIRNAGAAGSGVGSAATASPANPWTAATGFAWPMPGQPGPAAGAERPPADAMSGIQARMEALMREVADLRESQRRSP